MHVHMCALMLEPAIEGLVCFSDACMDVLAWMLVQQAEAVVVHAAWYYSHDPHATVASCTCGCIPMHLYGKSHA